METVLFFTLLLFGVLIFFAAAVLFACLDFILIGVLLYYKHYLMVLIGIPLIILIQSVRFRNTDIFADDCENFIYRNKVGHYINDPEWRHHMFAEHGTRWEEKSGTNFSRTDPYTYSFVPHTCTSQPKILYSSDNKCKVTIYHTSWKNNILWQEHAFTVMWENIGQE